MTTNKHDHPITVGVLALQGAFNEHIQLLRQASQALASRDQVSWKWTFLEVRTETELIACDALIIPGGESTTISLVAQRSNLLEPLREFVKVKRKPTWGTCAGLILLAESANRTKKGGQELIGGLDVRVNRNHFGRQIESFQADINLPFLQSPNEDSDDGKEPFRAIFIRAPIVEKILPSLSGAQLGESALDDTVVAPSKAIAKDLRTEMKPGEVEVLATLPGRTAALKGDGDTMKTLDREVGDIVAVRQGNCFGTSFHPELSGDGRVHVWWLERVVQIVEGGRASM